MQAYTSLAEDKLFTNQTFEIRPELKFARIGIDGCLHVTSQPKNLTWFGGRLADLEGVVRIKLSSNWTVIIDELLCTEHQAPSAVPGGVTFDVMPSRE